MIQQMMGKRRASGSRAGGNYRALTEHDGDWELVHPLDQAAHAEAMTMVERELLRDNQRLRTRLRGGELLHQQGCQGNWFQVCLGWWPMAIVIMLLQCGWICFVTGALLLRKLRRWWQAPVSSRNAGDESTIAVPTRGSRGRPGSGPPRRGAQARNRARFERIPVTVVDVEAPDGFLARYDARTSLRSGMPFTEDRAETEKGDFEKLANLLIARENKQAARTAAPGTKAAINKEHERLVLLVRG